MTFAYDSTSRTNEQYQFANENHLRLFYVHLTVGYLATKGAAVSMAPNEILTHWHQNVKNTKKYD